MSKSKNRLVAANVASQAYGRWFEIFQYICPGLFDEAIANVGQHVRCPLHGGDEDFRFIKHSKKKTTTAQTGVAMCTCGIFVDGFALLQRATGWGFYEVVKAVHEYLNPDYGQSSAPAVIAPAIPEQMDEATLLKEREKIIQRLRKLWNVADPVTPETATYYVSRGIDASVFKDVRDLRNRRKLGYFEPAKGNVKGKAFEKTGEYPALLGMMRSPIEVPVAIHRTWLTPDKCAKAPVPSPKKLTQAIEVSGAAVRLFDATGQDTLGISEGIETALAVRELCLKGHWPEYGTIPVWSCFSAVNIRNFEIPLKFKETIKKIVVFADNDKGNVSVEAALALQSRLKTECPNVSVEIRQPDVVGWDWLDFLVDQKNR